MRLRVTDTGVGMTPAELNRIFEPFFTTKPSGTGLGLAMVYGAVGQAQGAIDVTSTPGEGTCFAVYLPRSEDAVPRAPERDGKRRVGRTYSRVLVVEDDPLLRDVTAKPLRSLGHEVMAAGSVDEALRICEEATVDVLLTDVVMPGMNGKQLRDRVVAIHPMIRVLYMSGYPREVLRSIDVMDEGTSFLQKPFGAATLTEAISSLQRRS